MCEDNHLNQPQINFLWATLVSFELALSQAHAAVDFSTKDGVLTNLVCDIPKEARAHITDLIQTALRVITAISDSLGTEKVTQKSSNRIISLMNSSWVHLM